MYWPYLCTSLAVYVRKSPFDPWHNEGQNATEKTTKTARENVTSSYNHLLTITWLFAVIVEYEFCSLPSARGIARQNSWYPFASSSISAAVLWSLNISVSRSITSPSLKVPVPQIRIYSPEVKFFATARIRFLEHLDTQMLTRACRKPPYMKS